MMKNIWYKNYLSELNTCFHHLFYVIIRLQMTLNGLCPPPFFYVTAQKYNLVPQPTPIIASLSNFHISTFRLDNQDNNAGMKIILNTRAHSLL